MPQKKTENFDFERSLTDLNKLVEEMEQGELALEQSLKHFEQGVVLIRQCQDALGKAEQKVEILTKESASATLEPFEDNES